ncbi:sulfurtransferase [Paenibacillus gorillae]|uniref:sulfurtransferase n=1 Tax=Paenibacillus gorillae TaxID=1243662 RepID=UPI0004ACA938|nr:sulfurtransferase [Paenibacillus gorillae]
MVQYISVQELAAKTKEDNGIVIADCRFLLNDPSAGETAYEAGHISGAFYLHLERDLSGPKQPGGRGGRHPLPEAGQLADKLGAIGVGNNTTVVAYDDQGGAMASRLLWLLKWLGHDGEKAILVGGFAAWQAAGEAVSTEPPVGVAGQQFKPQVQEGIVVDAAYVRERIGRDDVTIIDSREAPRYRGEVEPIDPVAGHIPSAVNRFWKDGFEEAGALKPVEAQLERFAGLQPDDEIIVYCGSGVTATPNVIALESAGFKNVKLYAGSWSDWSSNRENPVAVGDE